MFRTGTTSVRMLQAVALMASLAVILWSLGLSSISEAEAVALTNVSDTLSNSDISAVSNHTIDFTIPAGSSGITAGQSFTITFPTGFDLGSVAFGDIDLAINAGDQPLAASSSGATWGVAVSGQDVTFTSGTATATSGDQFEILVGTNASGGANQVTNATSSGSYELNIALPNDAGATRVVILDNVTVSAAVNTVFEFSVSGYSVTGVPINGTSTTATSSATTIPFGTLSAGYPATVAQRLNVTTNANNGFVVTVQQSGDLMSATGADINSFANGSYIDTPTVWTAPSSTVGLPNTYGHWGLTTDDDLNNNEFGTSSNKWVAASTTPRAIFANNGPADGTTANVGSTTVGYQVEISALQEAADDYSTTLTYVATPTF